MPFLDKMGVSKEQIFDKDPKVTHANLVEIIHSLIVALPWELLDAEFKKSCYEFIIYMLAGREKVGVYFEMLKVAFLILNEENGRINLSDPHNHLIKNSEFLVWSEQ